MWALFVLAGQIATAMRRLFFWNDVGVASDFLPAALLFHPYSGKAKMLGFSGVGHFSAPDYRLVAGHDRGVSVEAHILNLPVIRSDDQETRK